MNSYILIFLIILVSFAVYFNAIFNGFVFDDIHLVVENYAIKDIKYLPEIFSTNLWAFVGKMSNYYRPLPPIIYILDYYIFGLKPWGFHLVNILFHTGISVLVFLIISRLLMEFRTTGYSEFISPPFMAAILFATHPIHSEAVTWVAGIMDLSCTFFSLFSFYLYIRSNSEHRRKGLYFLSLVSYFLATLSKEPSLTLPIILVAYNYAFKKEKDSLSDLIKRWIPFFIVNGIYFIMRFYALKGFAPIKANSKLSAYQGFIDVSVLFSRYIKKLLLPANLNVVHFLHPVSSFFTSDGIIPLFITAGFLVFLGIALKRSKVLFFSLMFIVVPLLPALYIPGLTQKFEYVFTERYLYFPSFGFVLFFALSAEWMRINKQKLYKGFILIVTATAAIYSLLTINRNSVWRNSYTLWTDSVRKSPDSGISHQNLGYALLYAGRTKEGKEQLQVALKLEPDLNKTIIYNGISYSKKGLVDKAILEFNTALIIQPDSAEAHYNLGVAYDAKGWIDHAIEQYQITLMLKPDYPDAHNNIGIAYGEKGLIDKAIEHFQEAIRLNPGDAYAYDNLAKAYEIKGLKERAEEQRQKARSLENR